MNGIANKSIHAILFVVNPESNSCSRRGAREALTSLIPRKRGVGCERDAAPSQQNAHRLTVPPKNYFGAPTGGIGGPLVNVFWAAAISHDWLCFVNTNIGNEVLISLPLFSALLVATRATATSGQRNRIATDVTSKWLPWKLPVNNSEWYLTISSRPFKYSP